MCCRCAMRRQNLSLIVLLLFPSYFVFLPLLSFFLPLISFGFISLAFFFISFHLFASIFFFPHCSSLIPHPLYPSYPSYPSLLIVFSFFYKTLSRTRRCARIPTAVCVFCCHKCHTKSVCPFIYPSFFHSFPWFLRRKKGENIRCCSLFVKTYLQSRRNRLVYNCL